MPFAAKRFRTTAMAILATAALGVGLIAGLGPAPSGASSHREAPLVAADPQVDTTDLYAFVSPDKPDTVTLIANWIPFEEPAGGPNFYSFAPGVRYEIRIDNNGDAGTDIIYRWVFTNHYRNPNTFLYNTGPVTSLGDPDLNFYQTYSLTEINFETGKTKSLLSNAFVVPSDVGAASMPDYSKLMAKGVRTIERGTGRTWAGQADDPFFLDLRVFDLLYGANFSEAGDDTLAGFGVNSVALQVPQSDLALNEDADGNPVIGVWTGTFRQTTRVQTDTGSVSFSGSYVDVSRLGMPLVNELVVPVGLKDYFNASNPINDAQFLGAVDDPELPHLINAVYGLPVPDSDPNTTGIQRADLIQVFLTGIDGLNNPNLNEDVTSTQPSEMLRLNMSIPPCTEPHCSALGVLGLDNAGFPNGRRLSDDIIDVALRVTEGILLPNHNPAVDTLGDGVDQNDKSFQGSFPYLASPEPGSNPNPHSAQQARD